MIKYCLMAALFFFCRTSVRAQQRSRDSVDILVDQLKSATAVVDSLRHAASAQYEHLEALKKKPATPARNKELKRSERRFDTVLVQLDSSTGAMEHLTRRLGKINQASSRH